MGPVVAWKTVLKECNDLWDVCCPVSKVVVMCIHGFANSFPTVVIFEIVVAPFLDITIVITLVFLFKVTCMIMSKFCVPKRF